MSELDSLSEGKRSQLGAGLSTAPNCYWKLTNFAGIAYARNDAPHKHAVTHLGGVQKYWYDANGSMTTRVEGSVTYQQAWDVESRLASVTGSGTTTFTYDGDGARVKKVDASGTTVYVGAAEVLINATQRITKTYYTAGAQLVAMRVVTSTGGNALYYLHSDHLGSTSLTTNSSGGEVARQSYYLRTPWDQLSLLEQSIILQYGGHADPTTAAAAWNTEIARHASGNTTKGTPHGFCFMHSKKVTLSNSGYDRLHFIQSPFRN